MFGPTEVSCHASVAVTALAVAGCAESATAAEVGRVDRIEPVRETTTTKPFVTHSVGADAHVRAEVRRAAVVLGPQSPQAAATLRRPLGERP